MKPAEEPPSQLTDQREIITHVALSHLALERFCYMARDNCAQLDCEFQIFLVYSTVLIIYFHSPTFLGF